MTDVEVVNLFGEPAVDPTPHGTVSGYSYWGCRCDQCREAMRQKQNASYKKRKAAITGDEEWHGTHKGYSYYGCRCGLCKAAWSSEERKRKEKRRSTFTGAEPWHGTFHGYNKGCRCEACLKAGRDHANLLRRKRIEEITGKESWHGTLYGYQRGCTCQPCRLAKRASDYGLNQDRFANLLNKARCKVCGTFDPGSRGWHIDHDHSCCPGPKSCGNCVREILCGNCNVMLGLANDDPEILRSAAAYIELHAA